MTNEVKEIRSVLLGRTVLLDDGRIAVLPSGEFHFSPGISDGAGAVRFFGVTSRSETFETKLSQQKVTNTALRCMQEIGRGLFLQEQPDTVACLIRYMLTKPTVLTFRYIDGVPVLTAWCGRSIMGLVSMRRALKDFNDELKEMTDDITVSEEKAPKPENTEKKDKQSRKEAKAAIKEAKKAEKEAKKVQKAQEKAAAALAAAEAAKAEAEARAAAAAAEAARLAAEAQQIAQEAEIPEPEVPEAETSAPEEQNE